jgi:DNA-directed RNA polymerase subunit L
MDGCEDIKVGLLALLKESPTTITLVQPSELQFAITMNQQGHTLGNALQGHITRRSIEKDGIILTCGYKQPHPLEESIVFYLSLNPNHKISKETELHQKQSVITFLMEQLDELKALFKTILECAQKTL